MRTQSDGQGNKARKGKDRKGKAQQGRESLQKMLNFLKARRRRKGGNPPSPNPIPPFFLGTLPPSPTGVRFRVAFGVRKENSNPGFGEEVLLTTLTP